MIKKQCSFKADNNLVAALKIKAKKENRSLSNLIETMLKKYVLKTNP